MSDAAAPVAALSETDISRPRQVDSGVLFMCGLAWAAGLIHVQAAIDHLDENRLYAVCFILLTAAQIAWGIAVYRSPERRGLLIAGAVGSLGVLAVWILSRTSGLPVGPESGVREELGLLDVIASADEIVLVLLVAVRLSPRHTDRAGQLPTLVRAGLIGLILLSSLVLGGGVHAH